MKSERELLDKLNQFLLSKGFPKNQLIREFAINQNLRVDFAVIDSDTNEIIGIFEAKSNKNTKNVNNTINQLKQYEDFIGRSIHKFAVFQEGEKVVVYSFDGKNLNEIGELPNYEVLKAITKQKKRKDLQDKRDSALNWFQFFSISGSFFSLIVFFLHITKRIELTIEDIVLVGLIDLLPLLPYANKIKIFGIEFERLFSQKKVG